MLSKPAKCILSWYGNDVAGYSIQSPIATIEAKANELQRQY